MYWSNTLANGFNPGGPDAQVAAIPIVALAADVDMDIEVEHINDIPQVINF